MVYREDQNKCTKTSEWLPDLLRGFFDLFARMTWGKSPF
jgi:hypothetical protein